MNTTMKTDLDVAELAADQIGAWLAASVAKAVKAEISDIGYDVPFDRYGLDSVAAVEMTHDLSKWLGTEFSPTLLYDYPTIALLSEYIATQARPASAP